MRVKISDVRKTVGRYYDVPCAEMLGPKRNRHYARPRQLAMYFARVYTGQSFPAIGRHFNRDHTTVIHACKRVESLIEDHPQFFEDAVKIQSVLSQFSRFDLQEATK